jgi:uncharacterized membrane protein
MPYCTNCGTEVLPNAFYCGNCGHAQPRTGGNPFTGGSTGTSGVPPSSDILTGVSDRTASILCYIPVFGIIPSIIVLASQKFRHDPVVRFNAFQSVYLFVAWLIVSYAMPVLMFGIPGWGFEHGLLGLLKLAIFGCWIYLLVKAANQIQVRLPIIGDLAARSATEQL